MSFSASSAVSSSRAATAATGSPTKRTLSRASACSSWLTGRMPKGMGSSLPTRVARTPGCAAARETSTARMRAWGCGERSIRAKAMRGRTTSSANSVWPTTLAAASTLTSGLPTTFSPPSSGLSPTGHVRGRRHRFPAHPRGGQLHRLEYLQIARAAAQVPGQGFRDLRARRPRVLAQELLRHEQEARRAVAALRGAQLGEGLLQGMQDAIAGQALHRRHVTALAFDGQGQAGQHGPAVHEDGAGPALPELAAVLGA